MSHSVIAHLLTLASIRNLELTQSIRLARMQLPGDSPGIAALIVERETNAQAMEALQAMQRKAA